MWNLSHYINLYLLDRRYLTGSCIHVGASPGRVAVVSHGGHKSQHSPSGQHFCGMRHGSCWPVGKMQQRILSGLIVFLYRTLHTCCSNRAISIHHRYNCCSHRYDHQLQLELRSHRTERIVIMSIGTDRNILLFVVNSLLCFKGEELRYFSRILNGDT